MCLTTAERNDTLLAAQYILCKYNINKNAFQQDAYRQLIDRMPRKPPPPHHACPPATHAPLPHMPPHHSPPPCMPPCHACPLSCTTPCHTWPLPYMTPPPLIEFLTHASENITFAPTSLRVVNIVTYHGKNQTIFEHGYEFCAKFFESPSIYILNCSYPLLNSVTIA